MKDHLGKNIFLIGFMGAGKSSVARSLHRRYHKETAEMDEIIVQEAGMEIPEIFASRGEACFRQMETDLIRRLQTQRNLIVSCGGGAALRKENVDAMKENGYVVLLTASPETIFARVGGDPNRPVLNGRRSVEGIRELLGQRLPKYEAAADIVISTDKKSPDQIADEIVRFAASREETFTDNGE